MKDDMKKTPELTEKEKERVESSASKTTKRVTGKGKKPSGKKAPKGKKAKTAAASTNAAGQPQSLAADHKYGFHSIVAQFVILLIIFIFLCTFICLNTMTGRISENYKQMMQGYLTSMAQSGESNINLNVQNWGTAKALKKIELEQCVSDMKVQGVKTSHIYVLNGAGKVLYSPNSKYIGKTMPDKGFQKKIGEAFKAGSTHQGKMPEDGHFNYTMDGKKMMAGYAFDSDGLYVVVMAAEESDVMSGISHAQILCYTLAFFTIVIFALIGFFLSKKMFQPVRQMNQMIHSMKNLDFTEGKDEKVILKRKDEFGHMSRSLVTLRKTLGKTIENIRKQSTVIFDSSNGMYQNVTNMSQTTDQVDHAVQEIAQGATNQADETQKANENVISIGNMISDTTEEVQTLQSNAAEMKKAQETAVQILGELGEVNEKTKASVEEIAEQTKTTNESATKIREVTGLITDIAEETNLLSLNASIEAARAGEAGRGFAVVASQIQHLADQSSESAKQIEKIIDALVADSEKAVATMDNVRAIIEEQSQNVEKTGEVFQSVSEGIDQSMSGIQTISDRMAQMDKVRNDVVDGVSNLSAIAEENAANTEESSASVTSITGIADEMQKKSGDLRKIAEDLEKDMSVFKY